MSLFAITIFSFLATASLLVTVVMMSAVAQTSPRARIQKRLASIGRNPSATHAEIESLLKSTLLSNIPWLNEALSEMGMARLQLLLDRANVNMTIGHFLLLCGFIGMSVAVVLTHSEQPVMLIIPSTLIAAAIPYQYLKRMAQKRVRSFLEQFPDALDVIGRGLNAGMGINQSMILIGKEMPDPVGTEFAIFVEEVNLGLPMVDALRNLQERIPLTEIRLLGSALVVQREAGGSLSELLDKLSDMIRDRFRIERQINSLTAQNRMSAWVVSLMPVAIVALMFVSNPAQLGETLNHPLGRTMFSIALMLELAGILVFRTMIRIRI